MAKTPRNILFGLGMAMNGQPCTMKTLRREFLNAGYGRAKATRWINLYIENEILREYGRNDNDEALFDCDWFIREIPA